MDKSREEEAGKFRGLLRSGSLIVPCLCDGNSFGYREAPVLMEGAVEEGGRGVEKICALFPSSATKKLCDLR